MFFDISQTASVRIHGWHHTDDFCRNKINSGQMIHLLTETTNICDQDCEYCYTVLVTLDKPDFHRNSLPGEVTWFQRQSLIDQASELGAVTYDVVGAGEPLLDKYFFPQINYAAEKGLTPVIFTNGSILGHPIHGHKFAEALWKCGASVIIKWHSQHHAIHDEIVGRKGAGEKRDKAINLLKEMGFNKTNPTRLGIDNIIYAKTLGEIPYCLRMCRENNLFLICSSFIPSGRTQKGSEQEASYNDIVKIYKRCREIDKFEYGINHSASMPYIGYGKTCTQYMGLYVTIQGNAHGCVGQLESYGNIKSRTLKSMWEERLPLLKNYDGGCPPRKNFYEITMPTEKIKQLF